VTAPVPPDFFDKLRAMVRKEVADAMRSGPTRNMSITGGNLTVQGGAVRVFHPAQTGGDTAIYFGDLTNSDTGEYTGTGLLIQDTTGTDMVSARTDAATGTSRVALRTGDIVAVSTDVAGGMAYPMVGGPFARARYADMTVSTASPAFETLWRASVFRQQPQLMVGYDATMDTGATTGEVRVLVDGVLLGEVQEHTFALGTRTILGTPTTPLRQWMTVEVQGRRTTAAGALRVEPLYWVGYPSG
jgi:hypothetical protein